MGTKIYTIIILIIFSVAATFSKCQKGILGCANTVYNFKIGVEAYPDKSSISLGDTIWFHINIPTRLVDINTNQTINFGDAKNLGSAVGFVNYSIINHPISAAKSFSTILSTGISVDNPNQDQIREYLFEELNGSYVFKLGVITKEKGVFGIGFSNAANVYRRNDKCTKAYFEINFANTRQHFYLNPNIRASNTDTTKPSGTYYFKVE